MQILGEGLSGTAKEQSVYLNYEGIAIPGDDITNDMNYKSDISRGKIYYESPSVENLFGSTLVSQISDVSTELFAEGPTSDGGITTFTWDTASHCTINYSIIRTPQINSIYPSTVFAGMDICVNVFTDYSTGSNKEYSVYNKTLIGEYPMDFDEYLVNNLAAISTWNNYQLCGIAGGGVASADNDITIIGDVGKFLLTDFAYSYDGTSTYTVRTIPKVDEISSNTFYVAGGQVITITGVGFGMSPGDNTVMVDDVECVVYEASDTQLKCVLNEKTTTTTATYFVGGTGARVKEYIGVNNIGDITNDTPMLERYFTDIESRRNTDDDDNYMVRKLEYWFVPPQSGDYIFHASCDDSCQVYLSTTDMDPTASTQIISVSWNGWRNFWDPTPSSIYSAAQTLDAGKHYYMAVTHNEYSGDDYMTVGFTIDDNSTVHPNSYLGWKNIWFDAHPEYEILELILPNDTAESYRVQFTNSNLDCATLSTSSDIFSCTTTLCPCVSTTFSANSSASDVKNSIKGFFNKVRSYYGNYLTVVKQTLDIDGVETSVAADINSYKFTITAALALSSQSTTSSRVFAQSGTTTATCLMTQNSTMPMSGNFRIEIPLSDGTTVYTEDLSLGLADGHIKRKIYQAAPEYIGKIEVKSITSKFASSLEGKDLVYQIKDSDISLAMVDSPDSPLSGGSDASPIDFNSNDTYLESSNKPFYPSIPAAFVRSYEESPQLLVTSNGMLWACNVTGVCDVTFSTDVSEITSYIATDPYTTITLAATSLIPDEIEYVAIGGTLRRCAIDPSVAVTTTSITCMLTRSMVAGTHTVVVQSESGAIRNGVSVTTLDVDIQIDSVSPTTIFESGGALITISGNYFPRDTNEATYFGDFSVTFSDGSICSVQSISTTEITCLAARGLSGTPNIIVAFNSKTATSSETFTITTSSYSVVSVNDTAICPVLKQDLQIVVSDTPSSNPDDYAGVLVNDDLYTIYLRVNAVDQGSNTLTVRYPGSPTNSDYTVYVDYSGERFSSSVILTAASTVTGITITTSGSPSALSTTGGDLITITGTGFSTTLNDNQVKVGSKFGDVLSATETELQVRAPTHSVDEEVSILIFLKLSIEPECMINSGAGCVITYDSSLAPTLTSENPHIVTDGQVTITGTGFGTNAIAYIGDYEQTTISSSTTEVVIQLTKYYDSEVISLEIRTDTVNLPTVTLDTPITGELTGVSPQVGSTGGELIYIYGNGFSMSYDSNFNVYIGSGSTAVSVCETLNVIDSQTLECYTIKDLTISVQALKVSLSHRSSQTGKVTTQYLACSTSSDCNYETSSGSTPSIDSISITDTLISVTVSGFTFDNTYTLTVYYGSMEFVGTYVDGTTITADFVNGLPPGNSDVRISFELADRLTFSTAYANLISLDVQSNSVSCSWAGGCSIQLNQTSILDGAEAGDISVTVCGAEAQIVSDSSTSDSLIVYAPSYVSSHSLETYGVESAQKIYGTVTSLPTGLGANAFDGLTTTQFKSTSTNNCYVMTQFEDGKVGRVEKVKFFMSRMTDKMTNFVDLLKIQGSNDNSTWTDLYIADRYMREGWNSYEPDTAMLYQYYRFFSSNYTACQIAEIQYWGNIVEDSSETSKTCDVVVTASGGEIQTFANHLTYTDSASSKVTSISPRYGTYKGGETLTITGEGFSSNDSEITVTIDGIDCVVDSASSTQITCQTGYRPSVNSNPSTILRFEGATQNGYASMQENTFKYANYWSDLDTWSGEYIPQEGDSVSIPAGQTLLVDVDSTPTLKAIVVEGSMIFEPNANPLHHRTFDAEYIFISEGAVFEAGTEDNRYTSKLTITMHGTRESPQLPIYGNKGIFVRHGQIDMHGVERDYTWCLLEETLPIGGNTIKLNTSVDWQIGEEIVIAPTDFEADHAEAFEIIDLDNTDPDHTVLTLNTTAVYKHYAGVTTYTGSNGINADMTKTLEMRAEVGLLTRNVRYKGADDDSIANKYGAHIMLHSKGDESLIGRFSYLELIQVGQAFQLGRYPIHFHMIGTVHNSYIKGNAIHHTYNRACTIHGVHYLTLDRNVAYETMGHTFFIEDAVETKNVLHNNLAVKTKRSWSLLNTDQTPASFWITNPDNQYVGNHAAGSDRYGFWFDLQIHSTGPSYDPNVWPEFDHLGEFTGNVAHSNGRYGLRIFHRFTPTDNPCAALATGAHNLRDQPDPTIAAPVDTHFRDFVGYKNKFDAIIWEELGALKFHNIRVADNLLVGVEFGITGAGPWLGNDDDYHLQDALIVGFSENYDEVQLTHPQFAITRGLKGARTEKMRVKDTIFADFDSDRDQDGTIDSYTAAIGTCSHCDGCDTDSSGRTYYLQNLYFINTTKRVEFDTPYKEILYDQDGSLGNSTHRWVVGDFKHLYIPECELNLEVYSGLICSSSVAIRRIVFHHPIPFAALKGLPMKIMNMDIIPSVRRRALASPSTCDSLSATPLTTIQGWDTDTYDVQSGLLDLYDQYNDVYTEYIAAVNNVQDSESASDVDLVNSLSAEMDSLSLQITAVENDVESNYGLFDDLYKSDITFCDTDSYQNFPYRAKANPALNWVIPVATGYEYKVHIGHGADFEELTGMYSYEQYIENDTDGIVIHFNHTERTEMFYFQYTDSSTHSTVNSTLTDSSVEFDDLNLMGNLYMNNVTRHMSLKLDNNNMDALNFKLYREECITVGGCNNKNMPEEVTLETEYRYWSNISHWNDDRTSTAKPTNDSQVIIESGWNMVMDDLTISDYVFKSIEINGRLSFPNDTNDYVINSYLIYVRKGELIVGYEDNRVQGTVTFNLYGTRADRDIYFHDKMFEGGNKVIANTGYLQMYGKEIATHWTRLAEVAPAGQNWIIVTDDISDWAVGDQLGIAPSGRDYTQRDAVTIAGINGQNVTLTTDLLFEHYGAAEIDSDISGSIDIRAEVVHLTRSIKVQGTNVDRWGAHIVTSHNVDSGFYNGELVSETRYGYAIIDHVELFNCSQYDTDKAWVRFTNMNDLEDDDIRSSVTGCSMHDGHGIGIMVNYAEDIIVDNNVVWFMHIGGIWMKQSENTTITNNVVAGLATRYWSSETRLDELAGFNLWNIAQNCSDLTVQNNIVAGFQRIGFLLPTISCSDTTSYSGNMAHSVEHGAWLLNNTQITDCHGFNGFQAYKTMEEAIFSYQGYYVSDDWDEDSCAHLTITDVEILDCGYGINLMIGDIVDHSIVEINNALIMGQSSVLPEDSETYCVDVNGLWPPTSTFEGKTVPLPKMSLHPYRKVKSHSNWFVEAYSTNVTFKNWESGQRSWDSTKLNRAIAINDFGFDHVPVHTYYDPIFDNVHHDGFAYLYDPPEAWAVIEDCGNFPCTAPENAVFKFFNATAIGDVSPNVAGLDVGVDFSMLPDNYDAVSYIENCTRVTSWNGYKCFNTKVGQLIFESLDDDTEDRTVSPMYIIASGPGASGFNNTLNSMMDVKQDHHYNSQKRLSRFPTLIEFDKIYEIYYTGTQPSNTRYRLKGSSNDDDYLHLIIDFSQARMYNVYANDTVIDVNDFNTTTDAYTPLQYTTCGENVYDKPTNTYDFYLTKDCTVKFEALNFVELRVRLNVTYSDFYANDGRNTLMDKIASVLNISQDKIRIVHTEEGSTIAQIDITGSTTTEVVTYSDTINTVYTSGTIDLGYPIMEMSTVSYSSTGTIITSDEYTKKDVSIIVFAFIAIAGIATVFGVAAGILKITKIAKAYREIKNLDPSDYEKGHNKSEINEDIDQKLKGSPQVIEESKHDIPLK